MSPDAPRNRLVALDALRGVAAVIVLVHHVSMTAPSVSAAYSSSANVAIFSTGWWVTLSPLKILFAGPEFVLVFFVLSGFVLVLTPLRRWPWNRGAAQPQGYDWLAYYPRRIIRLAVPVIVSVGLAAVWILLVPRTGEGGAWMAKQGRADLGIENLLREASILGFTGRPNVNPPLWSLAWEMWFSLLLPVGVILAVATRRWTLAWVALMLAVSTTGYLLGSEPLMYLPAFGLGALLAANYESLQVRSARLSRIRGGSVLWGLIAAAGPVLLISYWMVRPLLTAPWNELTLALRVPGAFLIVATVALWPPVQRMLSGRTLAWLGRISFSLYLVHFPIVVTFGQLFGPAHWYWGALVSVPLSVLLAQLMYRWVELPAQTLAGKAGNAFANAHPHPR
jgi:peptidoglycan/LPS O-acetylase OafA/YrhL